MILSSPRRLPITTSSPAAVIHSKILILDFGSQYTQLIARRVRELKVYCEIRPYHLALKEIDAFAPTGIILSGSPASSFAADAPKVDPEFFRPGRFQVPILGICYGFQLMAKDLGGQVAKAEKREYGLAEITVRDDADLFSQLNGTLSVWMSHGDRVGQIPKNFQVLASTENSPYAAVCNAERNLFAVQFHPEVAHTPQGKEILANFLFRICKCQADWNMHSFIETSLVELRAKIKNEKVILGLSGGVDSSVAALLLHKAIGQQLTCIFVDNGLLRQHEGEFIRTVYQQQLGMNVDYVDASADFLGKLKGVVDPEKKRKIIGETFIRVFEKEAKRLQGVRFLAQGTLYPDVIESVSVHGPSAVIKSHHNVGGLPEKMGFELVEPFRFLFKDEVRAIGLELGLAEDIVFRHPFPGPGLAVRVLGEITEERLAVLRKADTIFIDEIKKAGLYKEIWQAFAVLLPVSSVGVMGDERTYENTIALRAVTSTDGMTADWFKLPHEVLGNISSRITNEVKGVNRVVYDVSSKPPATIEWE